MTVAPAVRISCAVLALGLAALAAAGAAERGRMAAARVQQQASAKADATAKATPAHNITWARDIAPLVYANCTSCHHAGGAGPFSLLHYEDARRWAAQMRDVTGSRYMPPWLPEHRKTSAAYVAFADERVLSDAQIAMIAAWVGADMPQGDAAGAPPVPQYSGRWQHGEPDLILKVERPFVLPPSGSDTFRNFVLPYPLPVGHYVRAMEIRPGAPQIVHHANVLIDRTGSYRGEHPDEWKDGIPGMELTVDGGNGFDPDSHFLFWKPDTPYLEEPASMPWRLDPGSDLILNMHLKPSGKQETISAEIGLYFTDKPPTQKPMLLQLENDRALDIPAGAATFPVEDSLALPVDVRVLGIYPHTHYLGRRLEAWAMLPNGQRRTLIVIPEWDIDRQAVYRFREPVLLKKDSVLHMRYLFDNSAANVHNPHSPPVRVHAGNRSEDEMAHLWLQVLPVDQSSPATDPRLLLEEAWMQQRLSKEPADGIALYNLASTEALLGKYKQAVRLFREASAAHPQEARTLTGLGAALDGAGEWQEASATFEAATAAQGNTCDARYDLAELQLKHAEPAAAEKQLRAMLKLCPADAGVHTALGVALGSQGQEQGAVAEFEKSLAIDGNNFEALQQLGEADLHAGDAEGASKWLTRAAKLHPEDVDTLENLAQAFALQGLLDDATEQLTSALHVAPQSAHLHALLSQVLASNGHLLLAIEEQRKANALSPDDADGWNNLGVMEARDGNAAAARAEFLHALRLAPNHAQAAANLQHLPQPRQ